jgi:hypothetical protein
MRDGMLRSQSDSLLIAGDGVLNLALLSQDGADVHVRIDTIGL